MAYNKTAYNKRNKLIYEDYCTRWGDGLRDEVIYQDLSERYHLRPKTLEDIVRMVRKESQDAQVEIDFLKSLTPNPSPKERGLNSQDYEAE